MARIDKINEEVRSVLSEALRTVKDPRVTNGLVSITRADVSGDLSEAKIYFSVLGGDQKEVSRGLRSASGYLRRELAHRLDLRSTPELTFLPDNSIERGVHILELLRSIDIPAEEPEDPSADPEDAE